MDAELRGERRNDYGSSSLEYKRGNTYSRRYKRLSKDTEYYTIVTATYTTLDLIALQQYGSPLMYWLIADFNDYLDPTITIPPQTTLKIPRI